jgi:hypothetical protein
MEAGERGGDFRARRDVKVLGEVDENEPEDNGTNHPSPEPLHLLLLHHHHLPSANPEISNISTQSEPKTLMSKRRSNQKPNPEINVQTQKPETQNQCPSGGATKNQKPTSPLPPTLLPQSIHFPSQIQTQKSTHNP